MQRMTGDKLPLLWRDQYGHSIWAATVKDLRRQVGGGRVFKVYHDRKGVTYHIGYGVGKRWFTAYKPVEIPA